MLWCRHTIQAVPEMRIKNLLAKIEYLMGYYIAVLLEMYGKYDQSK